MCETSRFKEGSQNVRNVLVGGCDVGGLLLRDVCVLA